MTSEPTEFSQGMILPTADGKDPPIPAKTKKNLVKSRTQVEVACILTQWLLMVELVRVLTQLCLSEDDPPSEELVWPNSKFHRSPYPNLRVQPSRNLSDFC